MFGEGQNSILSASNPLSSAILLNSSGSSLTNLKIISPFSTIRQTANIASCVVANGSSNFRIDNLEIVDCATAGIMITYGSNNGEVVNNRVAHTLADGIHITGRSNNIVVSNNQVRDTGDDAIAVISYVANTAKSYRINIIKNIINNSATRGISAIGDDVVVRANTITNTNCAGIYSVSEGTTNLYSGTNLIIENNKMYNTTLDA